MEDVQTKTEPQKRIKLDKIKIEYKKISLIMIIE